MNRPLFLLLFVFSLNGFGQKYTADKELGAKSAEMVITQMGIYEQEDLRAYLQSVVDRLVAELPEDRFDFSVELVDQEEPNAFALPGGYLYVTRGVLAIINNEDQLAGILAHEIVHGYQRHSIQQIKGKHPLIKGILRLPGQLVGMILPRIGMILILPVEIGSAAIEADHSRQHEREADLLGIQLMTLAGYDPNELAVVLGNLGREVKLLTGDGERFSVFSDHPITSKRLKYLDRAVRDLELSRIPPVEENVLNQLDGLLFGPNPQQGLVEKNVFMHPDLDIHIEFGEDWRINNTPVSVVAANKKETAIVSLSLTDPSSSLDNQVSSLMDTLSGYENLGITTNEPIVINEIKGHHVAVEGMDGSKQIFVDFYLLEKNGLTFQLLGLSYASQRPELQAAILSFRGLNTLEKRGINEFRIGRSISEGSETYESFNARTGSHWKSEFGVIANGLKKNDSLESGKEYKMLNKQPYQAKE